MHQKKLEFMQKNNLLVTQTYLFSPHSVNKTKTAKMLYFKKGDKKKKEKREKDILCRKSSGQKDLHYFYVTNNVQKGTEGMIFL